jgi:hypothetical protein
LSLWLISLLMALLALGPFLHAHYGTSQATGFHVNGLQAVEAAQSQATLPILTTDSPMLSPTTDQESPAVGVVTSLPRFEADSVTPDVTTVLLLSFLILSVLQRLPSTWPWTLADHPVIARNFQAGFPPPAHAPPSPL